MYNAEAEQRERDQQAVINERNQQVHNQLRQLIEVWRNYANDYYCKTYNPGMAQGLRRAANDLNDIILRARASEEMGCTCDACLNVIRKEVEDEAKL